MNCKQSYLTRLNIRMPEVETYLYLVMFFEVSQMIDCNAPFILFQKPHLHPKHTMDPRYFRYIIKYIIYRVVLAVTVYDF